MQRATQTRPVSTTTTLSNQNRLAIRIYRALAATAWAAWKYADRDDADDYIQTIPIAKSLTTCGGFDHAVYVLNAIVPGDPVSLVIEDDDLASSIHLIGRDETIVQGF